MICTVTCGLGSVQNCSAAEFERFLLQRLYYSRDASSLLELEAGELYEKVVSVDLDLCSSTDTGVERVGAGDSSRAAYRGQDGTADGTIREDHGAQCPRLIVARNSFRCGH